MFICENCNVQIPTSIPSYLYTVATRPKIYPRRLKANHFRADGCMQHSDDAGGSGIETIKQLRVCRSCHDILNTY